ncbi:hypothetical protein Tco_0578484 [Tanacetum coccineum]
MVETQPTIWCNLYKPNGPEATAAKPTHPWCEGGDMGGGGVIATAVSRGDGGDGEVMERVRESEVSGWIDRLTRNILGFTGKLRRKSFPAAVTWWWPECSPEKKVVAGGGV